MVTYLTTTSHNTAAYTTTTTTSSSSSQVNNASTPAYSNMAALLLADCHLTSLTPLITLFSLPNFNTLSYLDLSYNPSLKGSDIVLLFGVLASHTIAVPLTHLVVKSVGLTNAYGLMVRNLIVNSKVRYCMLCIHM